MSARPPGAATLLCVCARARVRARGGAGRGGGLGGRAMSYVVMVYVVMARVVCLGEGCGRELDAALVSGIDLEVVPAAQISYN